MIKLFSGFLFAFSLGFFCRAYSIPIPAPPTFIGCALIFTITLGYTLGGKL